MKYFLWKTFLRTYKACSLREARRVILLMCPKINCWTIKPKSLISDTVEIEGISQAKQWADLPKLIHFHFELLRVSRLRLAQLLQFKQTDHLFAQQRSRRPTERVSGKFIDVRKFQKCSYETWNVVRANSLLCFIASAQPIDEGLDIICTRTATVCVFIVTSPPFLVHSCTLHFYNLHLIRLFAVVAWRRSHARWTDNCLRASGYIVACRVICNQWTAFICNVRETNFSKIVRKLLENFVTVTWNNLLFWELLKREKLQKVHMQTRIPALAFPHSGFIYSLGLWPCEQKINSCWKTVAGNSWHNLLFYQLFRSYKIVLLLRSNSHAATW